MKKCLKVLQLTFIILGLIAFGNTLLAQSPPPVFSTTGTFNRTIPEDFLGLNGTNVLTPLEDWNAIDDYNALAGSPMSTLRFPGGTVSNYWDWRRGFFLTNNELPAGLTMPYVNNPPTLPDNKLSDFSLSVNRISASPIFNLNILSSDYSYQLGSLYAANALNIPVEYIELGNEFYLTDADNLFKFPGVNDYLDESLDWTQSLKQHPQLNSARVALVGATSTDNQPGRRRLWLEAVLNKLQSSQGINSPDAVTLHYYGGTGVVGPIVNAGDVATMLSQPFINFQTLQNEELNLIQNSGTGIEVWLTEYNLFSMESGAHGTWAHGLYTAAQSLTCLSSNTITRLNYHTMSGNGLFGSIFSNNSGFNFPLEWTVPNNNLAGTLPWHFTACGYALDMVSTAINNANQAIAIDISGANDLGLGLPYPELYAWYFQGVTSDEIIVINLGPSHYGNFPDFTSECDLTAINPTWNATDIFNMRQISGNLMNGLDGGLTTDLSPPISIPPTDFTVHEFIDQVQIGNVTFAPYSVTRLWINHNSLVAHITDDEICENTVTTIRLNGGNPLNYSTSSAGVIQPNQANEPWLFEFTAPSVGISTTYTLNFTDGVNNTTIDIVVHPSPTLTVTTNPNTPPIIICAGSQVDLTANLLSTQTNPSISYVWTPSHDILAGTPTSDAISVTPSFDTEYQVFATDGFCWVAGLPISIKVAPGQLTLGDDLLVCDGQQIELIPIITGNYTPANLTYAWSTTETTPTIIATPTIGLNSISVTVTDVVTTCTVTDEIQISVVNCCMNNPLVLKPDAYLEDNINNFSDLNAYLLVSGPPLSYDPGNFVLTGETIDINGIINANISFAFVNCILNFSQDAQILLDKGKNLKFENCTLRVCNAGSTWNGVLATHKNAQVIFDQCTIEDAQYAIQLQNDAHYTIIDNTFRNCYVSIDIKNYFHEVDWGATYNDPFGSTNIYNIGYITGNTTGSTGFLGEPYLSQNLTTPWAGIQSQNVLEVTIGKNLAGSENYLNDAHHGIYSTNTSLFSYNNEFDNIYNFDAYHIPWVGCGIYSNADFDDSDRSLTIGNGFIQGVNTFLNSGLGVYAHGDLNCTIKKNEFGSTDPSNPRQSQYSLFIDYPRDNPVYISDNKFYDFQIGICGRDVGSYGTGQFIAEWNEFQDAYLDSPTKFYGTALTVQNPLGLSTGLIRINNNTINNPRIGIHVRMALRPQILNNSINFDIAAANLGSHINLGIWNEETDFADISHNSIAQSTFLNDPAQAPHLIGITCKDMNTAGIWCNEIHNMGYSMNLINDCLGTELHNNYMHNYDFAIWADNLQLKEQGTASVNWENTWTCDDQTLFLTNKRVWGGLNQPQPINWYHPGQTTPANSHCPKPSNSLVVNTIANADFIIPDACGTSTDRKTTEENRDAYFGSSINPGISNANTATYLSQNEVYKTLDFDTSLVVVGTYLDPNFESFYSGIQNSNIELFNQVKKQITKREFYSAQILTQSITDTNLVEINNKYVIDKYIQQVLFDSLSAADSVFLEWLSVADPAIYGSAVYTANAFLSKEIIPTMNISNRISANTFEAKSSEMEVYPNPFTDFLMVNSKDEQEGYLELYDCEMKLILSTEHFSKINTKQLSSGTYHLNVLSNKKKILDTFTVVKP